MEKLKLTGHSGCKLEIKKRGDLFVVIKTAKDKAYNPRLEQQAQKQKEFSHDTFRAPIVIEAAYNKDGLFTFSMEYINGFTLAEHLKDASAADIAAIAEKFLSLVSSTRTFDPNAPKAHRAKLADLKQKISHDGSVQQAFKRLQQHPWEFTAYSYCHGDLALENIIYKDGELYLIDFLDSYYDSWMQDFAKLFFDLESLWSYRGGGVDKNTQTRVAILKDLLLQKLLALPHGPEIVREIYHMALLHALRILPYATDEKTKARVHDSVDKLHTLIDSL